MKIKTKIFLATALSVLSYTGSTEMAQAANPSGNLHRFCDGGVPDPAKLVRDMQTSLQQDPRGNAKVNGCRANMNHFFEAFKASDPKASNLNSIADLPAYVRALVPAHVIRDMRYMSDCLYEKAGGGYGVKHLCRPRPLDPNEVVYKNPVTGALVLLSGCANPGVVPEPPIVAQAENPCIEVHWPTELPKAAVRFAYISDRPIQSGKCVIRLKMAGAPKPVENMPEECPDKYFKDIGGVRYTVVCEWTQIEGEVSQRLDFPTRVQNVSGSYYVKGNGDNVLYLPQTALRGSTCICWELADGTFVTKCVRKESFVNGVATIPHSMVYGGR